jgi:hypothetical protein
MTMTPPERTHRDGETHDPDRDAAIEEFVPEQPKEEVREVARGRTPRTPFSLLSGVAIVVLGFAAVVLGIVVLAIWLA